MKVGEFDLTLRLRKKMFLLRRSIELFSRIINSFKENSLNVAMPWKCGETSSYQKQVTGVLPAGWIDLKHKDAFPINCLVVKSNNVSLLHVLSSIIKKFDCGWATRNLDPQNFMGNDLERINLQGTPLYWLIVNLRHRVIALKDVLFVIAEGKRVYGYHDWTHRHFKEGCNQLESQTCCWHLRIFINNCSFTLGVFGSVILNAQKLASDIEKIFGQCL